MSAPVAIQDLVGDVVHAFPSAQVELDPLPSGVCFLWVTLDNRDFVLEYDPKRGTGVSENLPGTPPFVGHDHGFDSLEKAITFFKKVLAQAARPEGQLAVALHDQLPGT